jgi:hypothetical protein
MHPYKPKNRPKIKCDSPFKKTVFSKVQLSGYTDTPGIFLTDFSFYNNEHKNLTAFSGALWTD